MCMSCHGKQFPFFELLKAVINLRKGKSVTVILILRRDQGHFRVKVSEEETAKVAMLTPEHMTLSDSSS